MTTSDPTDVLLKHHRWSMHQLLDALDQRTDDELHRRFEMGVGSLHATVVHMLGALRGWTDVLAQRDFRDRLDASTTTFSMADLRRLLDEASDEFEMLVRGNPHDELLTGERGGTTYTFSRGAIMTHVTTHAMYHRAQCLNMLRQLGAEDLPKSAVVEWMIVGDTDDRT